MPYPVNTRTVARRILRFNTIDEAMDEAQCIVNAEKAGRLTRVGNWSTGQILGHLASWASYPYEGFPVGRAPWFVRAMVAMRKRKYLEQGLPAGVTIPGTEGGTYGVEKWRRSNLWHAELHLGFVKY